MNTKTTFRSRLSVGAGVGIVLVALLAVSRQSPVQAQDDSKASGQNDKMSMECPMMTGLKGIKLTADSPPLLMARAEELELTDEQQQKLKAIAQEAQRQATEVLTADQRSMIGESSGKAMSMMEIAMMRSKKMDGGESDMMCPMCKQKMEGMMKGKMMKKMKQPSRSSDTQ
ncbi:hypothetical protein [Novipirellula rosea]